MLVTGANGFVGARTVGALAQRGGRVLALTRRAAAAPQGPLVEEVVGDFTDRATIAALAARADEIVHTAAAMDTDLDTARRVNRDGTRQLVQAAREADVRHLVHISTTSVYDRGAREVLAEDAPRVADGDPYAVTKAEAEREVEAAVRGGLSATILRPPAVLGWAPTSTWGQVVPQRIREGQVSRTRDPRRPYCWVHVDDLVGAIIRALEQGVAGAYNVVGGATTWGRYVADVAAWFAEPVDVPDLGAAAGAAPNAMVDRCPADRITADLGFRPQHTWEEGMAEAAAQWS